jgi:hypothetical protein
MKITRVTDTELVLFLIGKAKENGLNVCENYERYANEGDLQGYNYFHLDEKRKDISGTTGKDYNKTVISVDEMMEEIKKYKILNTGTFKLTKDYTAEIDYSGEVIRVGCQTIPFKTVNELYKKINNL